MKGGGDLTHCWVASGLAKQSQLTAPFFFLLFFLLSSFVFLLSSFSSLPYFVAVWCSLRHCSAVLCCAPASNLPALSLQRCEVMAVKPSLPTPHDKTHVYVWSGAAAAEDGGAAAKVSEANKTRTQEVRCLPALWSSFHKFLCASHKSTVRLM